MLRHSTRARRGGVVGAWMVVALLGLLGIAALVVDIGSLIAAAQRVQDVVDAAALAGAARLPETDDARFRLQSLVMANNAETPAFATTVTYEDVVFQNQGANIEGYGTLQAGEHSCQVTGRCRVEYAFARIFAIEGATVVRSATAVLTDSEAGGGSGGIFFAAESAPNLWGVSINGSSLFVDGTVHPNTGVVVNGSHQTVTGVISYRNQCVINGAHQEIEDTVEGEIEPYPIDYDWNDYYNSGPYDYVVGQASYVGAGGTLPTGDWLVQQSLVVSGSSFTARDSTFMVGGDLAINGAFFEAHNCIFMVEGNIYVNGAQIDLDECTFITREGAYFNSALKECSFNRDCDGLFCMAEGAAGITYNGARQRTEGIVFAPNGPITYNGAHQEVYNGGLCARTITVNGSSSSFIPHEEYGWGGVSGRRVILVR